jgi:hypothetical protein
MSPHPTTASLDPTDGSDELSLRRYQKLIFIFPTHLFAMLLD